MSEIVEIEIERILSVFLPKFNEVNGTSFTEDHLSYETPKDFPLDIDIFLVNGSESLKIQVTKAIGNSNQEYEEPNLISQVCDEVEDELNLMNLKADIFISFKKIPERGEVRRRFVFQLTHLVRNVINKKRSDYWGFRFDTHYHYINKLESYLEEVEIKPSDSVRVSRFCNRSNDHRGWFDCLQKFCISAEKKTNKIEDNQDKIKAARDMILMIDYDHSPVDEDYYLPLIKDHAIDKEYFYNQVWICQSRFPYHNNAWKIK